MDLKDNLAKNLVRYRKAAKITQAELAQNLNYSDKAISKWERGESAPDVFVIYEIAKLYNIKVDALLAEPKEDKPNIILNLSKKRTIICLTATGLVWLVAICFFAFIRILLPSLQNTWLSFIVALPVSFIVLLIFTGVWGKNLETTIMLSLLVWTALLSVYLICLKSLTPVPRHLWEIFLIGIPLQALIIFWFLYKKIK